MPVLQQPVIPLDVPVLQQPELPLDVSDLQKSVIPVDGSVLQLFIFNSCCRTGISGEDLSRNSRGLCKYTRTEAAQAAIEQTDLKAAKAFIEQPHVQSHHRLL